MVQVSRHVLVPIDDVFAALVDPTTYPDWLVGCREIRSVDDDWPEVGSRFHHRVGLVGPLTVADRSTVVTIDAPHRLVLEVMARPFIRAKADFQLATLGSPSGDRTRITLAEEPIGIFAPLAPVLAAPTRARNQASLNALVAYLNGPPPRR